MRIISNIQYIRHDLKTYLIANNINEYNLYFWTLYFMIIYQILCEPLLFINQVHFFFDWKMKILTGRFKTSYNGDSNVHFTIWTLWYKVDLNCVCCCPKGDDNNIIWSIVLKRKKNLDETKCTLLQI